MVNAVAMPPIDARPYRLDDTRSLLTPSLVVYPDIVQSNLRQAINWAGGNPARLRPHAKTHKTIDVIQMELALGITKHKCATLFEADMLARAGAPDVLIAYPMVGPNIGLFVELVARYAGRTDFSVLVDHPAPVPMLADALREKNQTSRVMIDLDAGMGRTGVLPGPAVIELARQIVGHASLQWDGLHLYDGDVDSPSPEVRADRVSQEFALLCRLTSDLESVGLPVRRWVVAGTGTFAAWLHVGKDDARLEASPGTFVFSDWNYHQRFAELRMTPAAILWTRVVSLPRPGRLTCDLGHKAVAADPSKEQRVHFLDLEEQTLFKQNEEHLVVDTREADRFAPGDLLMAISYHICPTCALHRDMYIARNGTLVGRWQVAGRDRDWR
ncbi:alanine racemase [bacterium]|nr:alanine racemase [bacterium]